MYDVRMMNAMVSWYGGEVVVLAAYARGEALDGLLDAMERVQDDEITLRVAFPLEGPVTEDDPPWGLVGEADAPMAEVQGPISYVRAGGLTTTLRGHHAGEAPIHAGLTAPTEETIFHSPCGCCSRGCVCAMHCDVPRGLPVRACDYHGSLPFAPLDKGIRWHARTGLYLRVPYVQPTAEREPIAYMPGEDGRALRAESWGSHVRILAFGADGSGLVQLPETEAERLRDWLTAWLETRAAERAVASVPTGHVCCGCGGLCDSGEPCPMASLCRCQGPCPVHGGRFCFCA